jgi:hypothetical protein
MNELVEKDKEQKFNDILLSHPCPPLLPKELRDKLRKRKEHTYYLKHPKLFNTINDTDKQQALILLNLFDDAEKLAEYGNSIHFVVSGPLNIELTKDGYECKITFIRRKQQ